MKNFMLTLLLARTPGLRVIGYRADSKQAGKIPPMQANVSTGRTNRRVWLIDTRRLLSFKTTHLLLMYQEITANVRSSKTPAISCLSAEHRKAIFHGMLRCDYEARYWACVLRRYNTYDQYIKIVLLCTTSSGAFASLAVWQSAPWAWQTLSMISALLAILQNVFNYKHSVEVLVRVHDKLCKLQNEYENLWEDHEYLPADEALRRYRAAKEQEVPLANDTARFPVYNKMRKACQEEVFIEHRWNIPSTPIAAEHSGLTAWMSWLRRKIYA